MKNWSMSRFISKTVQDTAGYNGRLVLDLSNGAISMILSDPLT